MGGTFFLTATKVGKGPTGSLNTGCGFVTQDVIFMTAVNLLMNQSINLTT
jgi:hypothetical protein